MLLLLQAQPTFTLGTTALIALLAIGVSAGTNYLVAKQAQAEFKGVVTTKIAGLEKDVKRIDDEQKDQWSKIGEHTSQIGELTGRSGRAKAHHHHGS